MSAKQSTSDKIGCGGGGGGPSVPPKNSHGKSNNSYKNANKKTNKKLFKSKSQKNKNNNLTSSNSNTQNKTNNNNIANIASSNNNKNNDEHFVNDEIIEEFDFSDSELVELIACGENNNVPQLQLPCEAAEVEEAKEAEENVKTQMQVTDDDDAIVAANDIEQVGEKQIMPTDQEEEPAERQTKDNNGKQSAEDETNNKNALEELKDVEAATTDNEMLKNTHDLLIRVTSSDNATTAGNNEPQDNDSQFVDEPYDDLLVQILGETNNIAEARLAARRQARAEAREIRMRELERQQKEQEVNADRVFDMHSTVSGIDPLSRTRLGLGSASPAISGLLNSTRGANSMSSRRSSEDSLEEEGRSLRDIRHELKDVEERFRKAMIANAQLDNERASQTYQIQLLKDKLEDMEESYAQLQREFKEKSRDCNALKRSLDKLSEELKLVQGQLNERDTLISEQGLVIVAIENEDGTDAKRALVSVENAQLLGSVQGSLDVRLKKFTEEKQQLQAEIQQLQEQLETYKSQGKGRGRGNSLNGPLGSDDDDYEAQREANKIISDYKYKLQKAEQEIASLQSSLARSETQVIRYKSTAEAAEKAESELKIERRKLQRENREAMEKLEELETSNNHLIKRLDKLKNAKSALLKDL